MTNELDDDAAAVVVLWTKYLFAGARLGGNQDREQTYNFSTWSEAAAFLAGAQLEGYAKGVTVQGRAFLLGASERPQWVDAVLVEQDPDPDHPSGIRQAVGPEEWQQLLGDYGPDDADGKELWSDVRACWCVPRSGFANRVA